MGGEQGREREGEGEGDEGIEQGASVTAASYSESDWSGRGVQRRREKSLTETRAEVILCYRVSHD